MSALTNYRNHSDLSAATRANPEVSHKLDWFLNKIENHPGGVLAIPDTHAPTQAELDKFNETRNRLNASLKQGDRKQIALRISEMFSAWPSARYDAESFRQMTAAYVAQVETYPLWIVDAAAKAMVARGGSFPPSAGDLAGECERQAMPIKRDIGRLDKVLGAQVFHVETESEKARVSEGFDKLREDLALHDDRFHKPGEPHQKYRLTKVDYERMVEEMERNPVVLPPMSNALKKIVRQQEEGV